MKHKCSNNCKDYLVFFSIKINIYIKFLLILFIINFLYLNINNYPKKKKLLKSRGYIKGSALFRLVKNIFSHLYIS